MGELMKAARYRSYGGSDVIHIEDVPKPLPGSGQVLVQVHAASINPIDWKMRAGYLKDYVPIEFPATPGQDLAGIVAAVGAGANSFEPGDPVFAMTSTTAMGACADYVVLDEADVAAMPQSIDATQAAAVPMGALTAWQGLVDIGGLRPGDHLLVHGAGGNVGGMAVQIAHALGAHVTAVAYGDSRDLMAAYGADRLIDYRTERFEEIAGEMDVIFDPLAGDIQTRSWGLLRKGGILVSTLGITDPQRALDLGVRAAGFGCQPNGRQLAEIARMIDAGSLKANVGEILPLEAVRKAHDLSQTGAVRGKIVLRLR